ncbi:MAG: CYTH domain-containing protein, partial [Betaproteobacteria bacterium]
MNIPRVSWVTILDMAKDREIELKLAIARVDAAAFRRHPLLREKCIEGPARRKVFNVYFDTPGLALKQHAMALRLRKTGGRWLQTLKTAGVATGGLHQRGEWEYPLGAPQLDLSLFRDTPLASLAQAHALHLTLRPAFTTEFQRTTWLVEFSPGQQVEVALDQGVIRCG